MLNGCVGSQQCLIRLGYCVTLCNSYWEYICPENLSGHKPLASAGQLVAFVPTKKQRTADRHSNRGMCDNSDAIHHDILSVSHVSHRLGNIIYLQNDYSFETANCSNAEYIQMY